MDHRWFKKPIGGKIIEAALSDAQEGDVDGGERVAAPMDPPAMALNRSKGEPVAVADDGGQYHYQVAHSYINTSPWLFSITKNSSSFSPLIRRLDNPCSIKFESASVSMRIGIYYV
ncbi:hypothetical protein L2E82_27484 [Cichorium intybus]|uniref:Uncharacterized protein n=1 Tax=Cichorium intybus TaxID=13427 RepID=A0ACB9CTF1_CICIN|nr:hypothetical protein L2E82_27484 [Cichorium intybus]